MFQSDTKEGQIAIPMSQALRNSRKPCRFREGLCLFVALAITGQFFLAYRYCLIHLPAWKEFKHEGAANSTLGFGNIYAVSREGSPRRHSLLEAVALTNLDITIPAQPTWKDQDIASIQASENSTMTRGSALAWLGHRNVLETFLGSNEDTALIMEDDVDWDTRIRTQQIPQTAYAIQELLASYEGYYGSVGSWDIIWLGHCGDYFNASRGSDISTIKAYNDPAMPDLEDLHPWTQDFLHGIGAHQNQQRFVHESVRPLCTFAYAITRTAARRVLNELAIREPARDAEHPCIAYDVRLLESCRDEGLRCISVNPELFHHSNLDSEIAKATEDGFVEIEDAAQKRPVSLPATNIRCSARSKKWKIIQDSITDRSVNAERLVRDLAESIQHCYIDDV